MSEIDRYLNEVCWAMGGRLSEQQAARDELRAHILAQAREHELTGLAPQDALSNALTDLGDATVVGKLLRASRGTKPLRKPLVQPDGAIILERRNAHHLPPPAVVAALGASALTTATLALIYLWP